MTQYVRCPYAFWLLDKGQIDPADIIDEPQRQRLLEGHAFEEHAVKEISQASTTPIAVAPDRIDVASGALLPIEVKSHKDIQRIDELELAFYWMLLEPYRTRTDVSPVGRLILRRGGHAELVQVPIRPHRFEEVLRLVEQVRRARRQGVRPRI